MKRAPGLFAPYLVQHHCAAAKAPPPVEQATAAPGERRIVGSPPEAEPARPRRSRKPAEE